MKDELMRRISAALDSADGLSGDPALQDELRGDKDATRYAKDLTRLGKWLGTWPLPEPDDASFEALAARIEQRLDEPVGTATDVTAPPAFDDDDALRDATASLLQSGEFRVSDASIEILSDPSSPGIATPAAAAAVAAPPPPPPPPSPDKPAQLAKVALGKARAPNVVEQSDAGGSGEPLSAAELELRLGAKPKKKKKKKADGSVSSDRISIPTPKPLMAAPALSPVVQLPKAEERKPAATIWWFAAAAAVGLGVFGAATLFDAQATPATEGATLVTTGTIAPTASAPVAAPTVAAADPLSPPELAAQADGLGGVVAPVETARPTTVAPYAPPSPMPAPPATRATAAPPPPPSMAPSSIAPAPRAARGASTGTPIGDSALADDFGASAARHRSAGGGSVAAGPSIAPTTPTAEATTAEPTTTSRVTRAPEPTPSDVGSLPETPDRSTIQAVLAARTEAVTACANGAHGLADVDIVIASSGRITTATVNGSFAGTPIGSCIARAVRAATFPPFSQPRFEVTYPFHL